MTNSLLEYHSIKEPNQPRPDADIARDAAVEGQFIDDIYEIALDPWKLDDFISRVQSSEFNGDCIGSKLGTIELLSTTHSAHLERAESFLDRIAVEPQPNTVEALLEPFERTASLIVDARLNVLAQNSVAERSFSLHNGDPVERLPFDDDDTEKLVRILRRLFQNRESDGALMHLRTQSRRASDPGFVVVFYARWVESVASARGCVLLATTELAWPESLDETLHEVFALTDAERDILRQLVEGRPLKTIARDRDRSLGTVRTQLKSVLAKTKTHSQSELIRVTLSLMEVIKHSPAATPVHDSAARYTTGTATKTDRLESSTYSMTRPDGRRLEYVVQGDPDGLPVVFSHMGYGLLRWPPEALDLAEQHQLKIISPVRSGFGQSDALAKDADLLAVTRGDTLAVLDNLNVQRCPYIAQGNDALFAFDFAAEHADRVSEIIGLGPRLPLGSQLQYSGMGRWHRFLLSTARHAPHLLYFTTKAAFTLARKIGRVEMFRNVHRESPADLATINDPDVFPTLARSSTLALSDTHHAAFAYAMELLETEADWFERVSIARNTPGWFVSGLQDPLGDLSTIAAYEERFPWLEIETLPDAGQLLFFQKFRELIPRIARSAHGAA